jgi:urease accessory protein
MRTFSPRPTFYRGLAGLTTLLVSGAACAHPGHAGDAGFLSGCLHPFTGLDHLLAFLAVGLWAAQQKTPGARWQLPLACLAALWVGSALAIAGIGLTQVEAGVAASLLVLGLCIAAALSLPMTAALPLVALFALLHGHAHGSEMPADVQPLAFVAGFSLATVLLLGLGMGLGRLATRRTLTHWSMRLGGLGIAAIGTWLSLA